MRKNKKDKNEYPADRSSKLRNVTKRAGGVLDVVGLLVGAGLTILEAIKKIGGEED